MADNLYEPLDVLVKSANQLTDKHYIIERIEGLSPMLAKLKGSNTDHRNAFIAVSHHIERLATDLDQAQRACATVDATLDKLYQLALAEKLASNSIRLKRIAQTPSVQSLVKTNPQLDQTNMQDRQEELQTNVDGFAKDTRNLKKTVDGLPAGLTSEQIGIAQTARGNP